MERVPEAREEVQPDDGKASLRALARRIRSLRDRQGLTQEDFAVACGISVSFASLLERGARSPSYETLVQVSAALKVSLSELFQDAPESPYDDPYFSRLLEFARGRRLSRTQVDRLIAVASAMFEERAREEPPRPSLRAAGGCLVDGCSRPVLARGLCASHYHRQRRAAAR